ncbi:23S rRNA (pseudouridine(1915)-N(3))-methyltransferase RlmH [Ureaplasma miroungigenitalium]|uniref:Ribosomal RNA large subunit methyltransferase H n=1 Tax=Ureaplasma miroungigenitalium TaxID=1042321 RepID=A0ABT3BN12_9BACT|nr:23S rRNA (pseudouridine(1915)-N(3))-methyltransferase RlmH [Ureaplasma miroungigenitalium]MCV3728481.1 23S rRNA (pseudouridine(1915)-N(3))-methyltransferase RlmH [Ureaplasma miroungigenitalium]MCV3734268.1 23S rRNA (pseudouridine(1915)-N(3))-methyltransferase RlmH [Ureaplasma miroungigenitalium]
MYIKIISVGKIKTEYWTKAIKDYVSRTSVFCKIQEEIINDLKEPNNLTDALIKQIKKSESEAILKKIKPEEFVICLAIEGKSFDSVQLAELIKNNQNISKPIVFVIGGSHGLDEIIYNRANVLLSISKMTFAHNLAKVILVEQIYRAFNILHNTKYHK